MNKPDGAVKVETTLKDFFKNWLRFLRPFHGLSEKQIALAAAFLEVRFELSQKITDDDLLDEIVLSTQCKRQVREMTGFSPANFQVALGDLRKHGFIEGNKFAARYIPRLKKDQKTFSLLLYFPIEWPKEEEKADE